MRANTRWTYGSLLVGLLTAYVVIDLPAIKRQILISSGQPAIAVAFEFKEEKNLRGRTIDRLVGAVFKGPDGQSLVTHASMALAEYRELKRAVEEQQQADGDLGKRLSETMGSALSVKIVREEIGRAHV